VIVSNWVPFGVRPKWHPQSLLANNSIYLKIMNSISLTEDAVPKARSWFYYCLIGGILLVTSVTLNLILAKQLRGANAKLAAFNAESTVEIGASVPDIEARTPDGKEITYSFATAKRPTVLYIFSPSCGWCKKNQDNLKVLYETKSSDFQFVGISTSNTNVQEYIEGQNWKFPVFTQPSVAVASAYKIGGTPQTFVVSEDGKVMKNWKGAYSARIQKEVEDFFHISLPGLRQP